MATSDQLRRQFQLYTKLAKATQNEGADPEAIHKQAVKALRDLAPARQPSVRPDWPDSFMDVEEETPEYLFDPYVPRGYLTSMMGIGGVGKSTVALAMATTLSCGGLFPGCSKPVPPERSLICPREDSVGIVKTRLKAMGADMSMIRPLVGVIKTVDDEDKRSPLFLDEEGVSVLRQALVEYGPGFVALDTATGYFPSGKDSYNAVEVRSVLAPVADLAMEFNVAIALIRHVNKSGHRDLMFAGQGSADFENLARSLLYFGEYPGNKKRRFMFHRKLSFGETGPSWSYEIADHALMWMGEDPEVTQEWITNPVPVKAQESKDKKAESFLRKALADGPRPARELIVAGKEAGLGRDVMYAARESIGASIKKLGLGSGAVTCWFLGAWQDKPENGSLFDGLSSADDEGTFD